MEQQSAAGSTRRALLEAARAEFHRNGFQGASLSRILDDAGVSRGGMYHHFPGKSELGYAVVEELIAERIDAWSREVIAADDPVAALQAWLTRKRSPDAVELGCPLANLALEMSPIDEGFRVRIRAVFQAWEGAIATALEDGVRRGILRADVDPGRCARFILASFEGGMGLAKNARSPDRLEEHLDELGRYLERLRARPADDERA